MPLISTPFFTLVAVAVLKHSGREDLVSYGVIAPLLMTLAWMGIYIASEVVNNDRQGSILEVLIATPSSYFALLLTRVTILCSLGLIAFAESWLIARLAFGVSIHIYHPEVLIATLVATIFASAGTSLITAAIFCFGRSARTLQGVVGYPLFVLGGVLVPVTYLPGWIEPLSRGVFLYWAANLLRDSTQSAAPAHVGEHIAAVLALGAIGAVIGTLLLSRMLTRLRQEGDLGLV
jgi:ABC-2 type transport system permease protein